MRQRKDSLVPIGDALADLGGPVQAIRDTSPQALHRVWGEHSRSAFTSPSRAGKSPPAVAKPAG